jgi:2-amino-4-hydroxy-6-hydroxymethyldihydropteridine diphosphokinase
MSLYCISLGSNIRPKQNISRCLRLMKKHFSILKQSSVFQTLPFGMDKSSPFLNLTLILESPHKITGLRRQLRLLEKQLGRTASHHGFVFRPIDIDLLPYKNYLDHPFVMIPLAEMAPRLVDSQTGKTMGSLAGKFKNEKRLYRKVKLKAKGRRI